MSFNFVKTNRLVLLSLFFVLTLCVNAQAQNSASPKNANPSSSSVQVSQIFSTDRVELVNPDREQIAFLCGRCANFYEYIKQDDWDSQAQDGAMSVVESLFAVALGLGYEDKYNEGYAAPLRFDAMNEKEVLVLAGNCDDIIFHSNLLTSLLNEFFAND